MSGKLLLQTTNEHVLEVFVMIGATFYFERAKLIYCAAADRADRVLRFSGHASRSVANVAVQ